MLVFQFTEAVVRSCSALATLLKKRLWHRCFPVNFVYLFFIDHLQWLLLSVFGTILCITKVVQQIQSFFQKPILQIFEKFLISLITKLETLEFNSRWKHMRIRLYKRIIQLKSSFFTTAFHPNTVIVIFLTFVFIYLFLNIWIITLRLIWHCEDINCYSSGITGKEFSVKFKLFQWFHYF